MDPRSDPPRRATGARFFAAATRGLGAAAPEPSTWLLLAAGFAAIGNLPRPRRSVA
ncbi:MAG: PEP-CTERM sorting domain-containing protein [Burkholderiales bacterium]|nr:PEP-CTERM sorting domain-containing protein [Burkholderiales bacterium]